MSTPLLKLYKGSYNSSELLTKCTEGAIVFDNSTHRIYAGTDNNKPVMFGSNIQDADFTSSILKIWKTGDAANNPSIVLDFSDIASATSMMAVFTEMANKMGLSGTDHDTIDYTGTNYLTSATSLIAGDKALDTAIKDVADDVADLPTDVKIGTTSVVDASTKVATIAVDGTYDATNNKVATEDTVSDAIEALDGSATIASKSGNVVTIKTGVTEDNGVISNDSGTDIVLEEVAVTGAAADVSIADADGNFTATDVEGALAELADAISDAGKVDDVKINNTSIVTNKIANLAVDGTYDATNNKIATKDTVSGAIEALDVSSDKGGASVSGSTITITGVQQEDGLIKDGGSTTINLDGTYNDTTNKVATQSTVTTAIEALDGSATIASKSGNVVTIKTGVTEADGVISNDSGTDIVLEEVAVTGAAADVSIADAGSQFTATDVEGALSELATAIAALQGDFDVIVARDAATTPAGVQWDDHGTTITGTMAAVDGWHKIVLVPGSGSSNNNYDEYTVARTGTDPNYTYTWEKLGRIDIDLSGYVRTITVNSHSYTVTSNNEIDLGNIINAITGETAISGGESGLVAVTPTTTTDANGVRTTDLDTTVLVEEVADGLTKDVTPTYSADHYVIENGKLVSAVGKSSGDTYTKSANDGLVKASDVKAYVDSSVADSAFRWSEWS